jgi:hypothetical protein
MAFNPFHSFRKHSKVVFAGLTILCMVTFILSSGMGRGDFFSQMTDWFSGRVSRNTVVTIHGKQFSGADVDEIYTKRRIANEYMDAAVASAMQNLELRFNESLRNLDRESQERLRLAVSSREFIPFLMQRAEAEKKTDLVHALAALSRLWELQLIAAGRRPGEHFFGLTDNGDKLEDAINFLIWRHQADQLGVRLADDDIGQMIMDETRGELTSESAARIDQYMRERFRNRGYSVDVLYAALRDEFRVRIAQLALTGTAAGVGLHTLTAPPTELTPQESWTMFQDARTTVRVGMIDVPIKDFLAKVTATPSDDELKKLFDKYKNDEPAPDRDQPGFKEPRKVQVEWVGATADIPHYQKLADMVLAVAPALRLLGNTGPTGSILAPIQLDAEVLEQEKAGRKEETPWWDPLPTFRPRLHESSLLQAEDVATLVAGGPNVLNGVVAVQAAAARREAEVRLRFGVSMIGFAADQALGAFAAPVAALPKTTLAQVRPQLLAKARAELLAGSREAQFGQPAGLVAADLYAIRGEVMKLGREKGKEAVEKYVADVVKERGLEHGRTAEPRDQYHLGDDPGLSPLKQAYQKAFGNRDLLLRGFGPEFFRDQSREIGAPDGVFIPHKFVTTGMPDEPQFYWWRTEDTPPKTPKFDRAKAEVVAAWKQIQARDMAKKQADRILAEIQKTPRQAPNLRDAAAQNGNLEYFELGPMALFMPQQVPTQTSRLARDYATLLPGMPSEQIAQAYQIPADRVPYPDADMVRGLLDLRKDPVGATAIVTDKPKQNYYVATLLLRQEPDQDEFRRVYRGSMARATEQDPLLAYLRGGRADEYRKAIVEQLRKEAKVEIQESARQRSGES